MAFVTDPIGWYVEYAVRVRGIIKADEVLEVPSLFDGLLQLGNVAEDWRGNLQNHIQLCDVFCAEPERFVKRRVEFFGLSDGFGKLHGKVCLRGPDALWSFHLGNLHFFEMQQELKSGWSLRLVWNLRGRRARFGELQNFWPELIANPVELDIKFGFQLARLDERDPAPRTNEIVRDRYG